MDEYSTYYKIFASFVLIFVVFAVRWLIVRQLERRPMDEFDQPKHWINSVKNTSTLLIVLGLFVLWLSELKFFALSIAAFVVAFVVATREFIQCLLGTLYQASTRTFSIGDWIQVGNHHGEVISSNWLSTTLLEIDMAHLSYSYTGKTLIIPNNMFVTASIYNLNFMRRYVAHTFEIVRESDKVNLVEAKDFILQKAAEYCEPFKDVAFRYSNLIEKRLGVPVIPDPAVRIGTTSIGKNVISISVFCPTQEALRIEQQLTADLMNFWYDAVEKHNQSKSAL